MNAIEDASTQAASTMPRRRRGAPRPSFRTHISSMTSTFRLSASDPRPTSPWRGAPAPGSGRWSMIVQRRREKSPLAIESIDDRYRRSPRAVLRGEHADFLRAADTFDALGRGPRVNLGRIAWQSSYLGHEGFS